MGTPRSVYMVFSVLFLVYAAVLVGGPWLIDRCTLEWLVSRVTSWPPPALAIVGL